MCFFPVDSLPYIPLIYVSIKPSCWRTLYKGHTVSWLAKAGVKKGSNYSSLRDSSGSLLAFTWPCFGPPLSSICYGHTLVRVWKAVRLWWKPLSSRSFKLMWSSVKCTAEKTSHKRWPHLSAVHLTYIQHIQYTRHMALNLSGLWWLKIKQLWPVLKASGTTWKKHIFATGNAHKPPKFPSVNSCFGCVNKEST